MAEHPAATVGILGGGQLALMLAGAAARIGVRVHVYSPSGTTEGCPADETTIAPYDDESTLIGFAQSVDVVTFETENLPLDSVRAIADHVRVAPNPETLRIAQDRLFEKDFVTALGIATTPYLNVDSPRALADAVSALGTPAMLKTRRLGYDGRGQVRIDTPSGARQGWETLKELPCILEGFVALEREFSLVTARSGDGRIVPFDLAENVHVDGILHTSRVPADLPAPVCAQAQEIGVCILEALDYVGILGIEFFLGPDGLMINELAPRVHNTGHWTQNACVVDQFEQHIRAITGRPLGDGKRHVDVVMTNLLGDSILKVDQLIEDPSISLHLYGKGEAWPGRKMGHYNQVQR